nr:unnamed protein product [Callosobruchus analis]
MTWIGGDFHWPPAFFLRGYLMLQTSGVADKVYTTKWYEGTPSEMRDLQFMIARSHVACIIPATPFGRYEYALFITERVENFKG